MASFKLFKPALGRLLQKFPERPASLSDEENRIRLACEASFYAFVREAWPHVEGHPYRDGWHVRAICDHLEALYRGDIKRLLLNQPPRTSKSSLCAVMYPAWLFLKDPGTSIMAVSYSKQLTVRDSTKCRRLIQSPWYRKLWPRVRLSADENQKTFFSTTRGGYRIATSTGAATTGFGATLVLCVPAGTMIATPTGERPVESLQAGEAVITFSHEKNEFEMKNVVSCMSRQASELVEIVCQGMTLRCTPEHPVFVKGKGYIPAGQVSEGDEVKTFRYHGHCFKCEKFLDLPFCRIKKNLQKNQRIFCSKKCYGLFLGESQQGALNRQWKEKISIKCKNCQKDFFKKRKHSLFCSQACVGQFKSKNLSEKVPCLTCGKEIHVFNCLVNKKFYCSRDCANKKQKFNVSGVKNGRYVDGESSKPYGSGWTVSLKKKILERDGFICLICLKKQKELRFPLIIHHINRNKKNNNKNNLISVCTACHGLIHKCDRDLEKQQHWVKLCMQKLNQSAE